MQENEHKKEQSSRKQNEMQHKKSFVTRYARGEMLQKVAQKKSAPEHGEISESARKCEQKREFLYTICAGAKSLDFPSRIEFIYTITRAWKTYTFLHKKGV